MALWLMCLTPDLVVWVSSPGWGHCVVFLGKTLYFHSASLHPGVQMGTSKCAWSNPAIDQHPIQGGVASTAPMGHLGPYKGYFFYIILNHNELVIIYSVT